MRRQDSGLLLDGRPQVLLDENNAESARFRGVGEFGRLCAGENIRREIATEEGEDGARGLNLMSKTYREKGAVLSAGRMIAEIDWVFT